MTRYSHHKYEWSKPWHSASHMWAFVGPRGGLHFIARESSEMVNGALADESACLEIHYSRGFQPDKDAAPSQCHCWLTTEPCWHEGTSLYATETLWPRIKPLLRSGDHDAVFRILGREADRYFDHVEAPENE